MPELPEVETICRELESRLVGKKISRAWWKKDSRVFRDFPRKDRLLCALKGKTVRSLERKGKYLLIELSENFTLVIHLGMTGNLLLQEKSNKTDPHTHLELSFRNFKLSFRDPRTFGRVGLITEGVSCRLDGLFRLGPEPLSKGFNQQWLSQKLAGRKAGIKALLMNQAIGAGIGNIYSDEACFLAGISPKRKAGSLKKPEIKKLVRAIKLILRKAIKDSGTTISDYQTSLGQSGKYQPRVYGREGELCQKCGHKILRTRIGNRSSFYCPNCQK